MVQRTDAIYASGSVKITMEIASFEELTVPLSRIEAIFVKPELPISTGTKIYTISFGYIFLAVTCIAWLIGLVILMNMMVICAVILFDFFSEAPSHQKFSDEFFPYFSLLIGSLLFMAFCSALIAFLKRFLDLLRRNYWAIILQVCGRKAVAMRANRELVEEVMKALYEAMELRAE